MPKVPVLDNTNDSNNGPSSPNDQSANDEAAERQLRQQPNADSDQDDGSAQPSSEPQEQQETRQDSQDEPDNKRQENQDESNKEGSENDGSKNAKEATDDAKGLKDKFGGKEAAKSGTPGEASVGSGGVAGEGATAGTGGATAATGTGGAASVTAGGGGVAAGGVTASSGVAVGGAAAGGAAAGGGAAAAASSPVWVPVAIGVAIVIFVIVLVVIFLGALCGPLGICGGSTGTAEAAGEGPGYPGDGEPGGGIGLIDDFCQGLSIPCSLEFKKIIEDAAAWAQLPAAILVTVGLREYSGTYALSDAEILAASAPGAQLTPCPVNPIPVSTGEHATGPMQFIPSTWSGASYTYGNAAVEAGVRPVGYTGEICNVLDSYYAAAKYLKVASGMVFASPLKAWTRDELREAVYTYGSCTIPDEACVDALYSRYIDKSLTGVGDGSIPTGWPATGTNTQTPYCTYEFLHTIACTSHSMLSGVDISTAGQIWSTQDGVLEVGDTGDGSPCPSPRLYYGCAGYYALVKGASYNIMIMHRDRTKPAPCDLLNGQLIKAGTYLGWAGNTGNSAGIHVHYEIRNADDSLVPGSELSTVFPPGYDTLGAYLESSYAGENCIQ